MNKKKTDFFVPLPSAIHLLARDNPRHDSEENQTHIVGGAGNRVLAQEDFCC